jgi:hypothetical protein
VRAFVIKTIWSLYRDKGITLHWKPAPPPASTVGKKPFTMGPQAAPNPGVLRAPEPAKKPAAAAAPEAPVSPARRAEGKPAGDAVLRDFFRRILFTVPPGRLPKGSVEPAKGDAKKGAHQRPLPARKAKLGLVEVMRDLALRDAAFAAVVTPLFEEFMASRGASERAACLVALTRIKKAHPPVKKDAA